MPKYKVRLESPDQFRDKLGKHPHFRVTSIVADSAEAAQEVCVRREYEKVIYQLDPDALADLQTAEAVAAEKGVNAPPDVRRRLATHRQALPYEVVSVEEVA